jgi:hypothetical protein
MFKNKLNVFMISVFASGALMVATPSQAAKKKKGASLSSQPTSDTTTNMTSVAQYNSYGSGSSYGYSAGSKFALGYLHNVLASGPFGMIHGQMGINPQMWLGLGLGFVHNFDNVAVGPDLQYNFITKGATSLFGDFKMGFAHAKATGSGFYTGLLFGMSYGLTENFRVSVAYGLEMGFGDVFGDSQVGITNAGDFAGNFGAHWYF